MALELAQAAGRHEPGQHVFAVMDIARHADGAQPPADFAYKLVLDAVPETRIDIGKIADPHAHHRQVAMRFAITQQIDVRQSG